MTESDSDSIAINNIAYHTAGSSTANDTKGLKFASHGASRLSWFIVSLGVLAGISPFSIDMYLPAFDDIGKDLNTTIPLVQYSLVSFFAGMSLGQLLNGPISDRFGRKIPLQTGLMFYIISSVICAVVKDVTMLIIFRFFQAVGCSAVMVIVRAMIRDRFNDNDAAHAYSMMAMIMSLAPIIAPIGGGYIAVKLGWRHIFWFLAAFSFLCIILTLTFSETHKSELRPLNISFKSVMTGYINIIKNRPFTGYCLTSAFAYAGMFSYITGSSFIIIDYYGVSEEHFGWFFGANAFALILTSQLNNRLLLKYFYYQLLQFGALMLLITSIMLLIAFFYGASLWVVESLFFIYIGFMGFIPPNSSAGALRNHGSHAGAAAALMGVMQFLFTSFGSFAVGLFHNGTGISVAMVMTICGLLSFLTFMVIVKPSVKPLLSVSLNN